MNIDIIDPLVRVAFERKRTVEERKQALDMADRDRDLAQEGYDQALLNLEDAQDELEQLMKVMTTDQQTDLVLFELQHHQQNVMYQQGRALKVGKIVVNANIHGGVYDTYDAEVKRDPLQLQADDSLLNELQVVWRK